MQGHDEHPRVSGQQAEEHGGRQGVADDVEGVRVAVARHVQWLAGEEQEAQAGAKTVQAQADAHLRLVQGESGAPAAPASTAGLDQVPDGDADEDGEGDDVDGGAEEEDDDYGQLGAGVAHLRLAVRTLKQVVGKVLRLRGRRRVPPCRRRRQSGRCCRHCHFIVPLAIFSLLCMPLPSLELRITNNRLR